MTRNPATSDDDNQALSVGRRCRGAVVDLNTGDLRYNRLLVLKSPRAEVRIAWGPEAQLLDAFARDRADYGHPFFARAKLIAGALERSDRVSAEQLGLPITFPNIDDVENRRLAIVEALLIVGAALSHGSVEKASADDPKHPGWPAGTSESRGGEFRPKDDDADPVDLPRAIARLIAQREARAAVARLLEIAAVATLGEVPIIGGLADLLIIARAARDFAELKADIGAALAFVAAAPWSLDELRVSPDDQSFSSFDAFKKAENAIARVFGRAPPGEQYHHVVEQGGQNEKDFPASEIQSTKNIVLLPKLAHELLNAEYSKESSEATGMTVREWLRGQSFDVQYQYGIDTMHRLGIIK